MIPRQQLRLIIFNDHHVLGNRSQNFSRVVSENSIVLQRNHLPHV